MEINLLLRLLIAHLLTDFVLQPVSWVEDKKLKKRKSIKLLLHIIVTTLVAYIFSGYYTNLFIPVMIFISHYLIDLLKSYLKNNFLFFIADQLLHLLVIMLIWLIVENQWRHFSIVLIQILNNKDFWTIATGYIFVSWPLGIIIGIATQRWRDHIKYEGEKAKKEARILTNLNHRGEVSADFSEDDDVEDQAFGLANAGKWIGIFERILILTFVMMGQYTAIGFLMTAKSILRFSEKEGNTQLKTEYILVGTLVSFASSAAVGILISYALKSN